MSLKLISGCLLVCMLGSLAEETNKASSEEKTIPLPLLLRQLSATTGTEEDKIQVGPNEHVVINNEEMYVQPLNAAAHSRHTFPLSPADAYPFNGYWYYHTPPEYNSQVPSLTHPVHDFNGIPQDYILDNHGFYHKTLPKNEATQKKLVRQKRWGTSPCSFGQCGGGGVFPGTGTFSSASSSASSHSSSIGGNFPQPNCYGSNCGGFGGGGCRYGRCNNYGGCPYGGCGSNFNCGGIGCWRKRK